MSAGNTSNVHKNGEVQFQIVFARYALEYMIHYIPKGSNKCFNAGYFMKCYENVT